MDFFIICLSVNSVLCLFIGGAQDPVRGSIKLVSSSRHFDTTRVPTPVRPFWETQGVRSLPRIVHVCDRCDSGFGVFGNASL